MKGCVLGTAAVLSALIVLLQGDSLQSQGAPAGPAIRLTDVAGQAGLTLVNVHGSASRDYIVDTNGNGAAFFDYDNDDDLDALIVNGSTRERMPLGGDQIVALYRNDGKGQFTDVTAAAGLAHRGWGMGACVADYDNDGFEDVYVTAFGPDVLFRNSGRGGFTDVTRTAGLGDTRWSMNCAFGDYDHDGDVDLYVANYVAFDETRAPKPGSLPNCRYGNLPVFCGPRGLTGEPDVLYRNDGGRFTDVSAAAGIKDPGLYGFGVLFSDLDEDGWPDIFVANDSVPNQFYRNMRNGTFSEEGLLSGLAFSGDGREQASMGVDAGDYNGDGRLDLVVTNFSGDYSTLYENLGKGLFADVTHKAGLGVASLPYLKWGVGLVDLDNDGYLDLLVANGHVYPSADRSGQGTTFLQRMQLFRNMGGRRFEDVTDRVGGPLLVEKSRRGAAFGDYDNDGDIDALVVNMNDRPTLLRNDTPRGNHWVTIRLRGTRSNRDGIGARVRIQAGGRTHTMEVRSGGSYLSHNDTRVHAGVGSAARIDSVEIRWPSGVVDTAKGLSVDGFYVAEEGKGVALRPDAALAQGRAFVSAEAGPR
jgi:hypothetical protein